MLNYGFVAIADVIVFETVIDAFGDDFDLNANLKIVEALVEAKLQVTSRDESFDKLQKLFVTQYFASPNKSYELAEGLLLVSGL